MEWVKYLPWVLAFGFPGMAYWIRKNELPSYAKKSDVELLCQKLTNKSELLQKDLEANEKEVEHLREELIEAKKANSANTKLLFEKLDAMTKDQGDIKLGIAKLGEQIKHLEQDLKKP